MKRTALCLTLLTLAISSLGCGAGAREEQAATNDEAKIVELRSGSFPNWCAANDLITFTDEVDGRFEVFTMRPDGSDVRCLTADRPELAACGNRGQSSWHPGGEYIVFHAENAAYERLGNGASSRPGWGRNSNVWMMTAEGTAFWQLTDYPENWAVMEAKFSHDGKRIFWSEEYSMELYPNGKEGDLLLPGDNPTGPPYGHPGAYHSKEQFTYRVGEEMLAWRIVYADVVFGPNGPELRNTRKLNPPPGYTLNEANCFTPDDRGFIGCYSILEETNGHAVAGELIVCDLEGNLTRRLTHTPYRHDEDPCYSPDGSLIAFKETKGIVGHEDDIYLMSADGEDVTQLTHFAEPGYPEYDPVYDLDEESRFEYHPSGTQITEMCFSPDGKKIVFGHCRPTGDPFESAIGIPSTLYLLTLP